MDESLGLSEGLGAKEQESEGVAEKIQTTFLAALIEPRIQTRRWIYLRAMLVTRHAAQEMLCRWLLASNQLLGTPGEVNIEQDDEAQTTETATIQHLPSDSDEKE